MDASNEVAGLVLDMPHPPVGLTVRKEMRAAGWLPGLIEVIDEHGRPVPPLRDCLARLLGGQREPWGTWSRQRALAGGQHPQLSSRPPGL